MLHGIDIRTTPELLYCLARMGHGDEIVVVDANYPADSSARTCAVPDVIRYPGLDAPAVVDVITQLTPLDGFSDYAALRMQIDDAPEELGAVHQEVWDILTPLLPKGAALSSIPRPEFYRHAARCFAVVHCSEDRAFGCFILRKGVIQ